MENLKNELNNAHEVLSVAIVNSENLQKEWLKKEVKWVDREEIFLKSQDDLLRINKIQAQEISKLQEELLKSHKIHADEISKLKGEILNNKDIQAVEISKLKGDLSGLNAKHENCGDKIAALRSVARALESENQLLSGEKESLQNFKTQFCKENGALK